MSNFGTTTLLPKNKQEYETETVEEFLKRKGQIKKIPSVLILKCINCYHKDVLIKMIRKIYNNNTDVDSKKYYKKLCEILKDIKFDNVSRRDLIILKETMLCFKFDLSVNFDYTYSLSKTKENIQKKSFEIREDISRLFNAGLTLPNISQVVSHKYELKLEAIDIVEIYQDIYRNLNE